MTDPTGVFLPGEADSLQATAADLVVNHNITAPMLIETMRYAAHLRDRGLGLDHIMRAVDDWLPKARSQDIVILHPGTPCEIRPTDDPLTGAVLAVAIYPNDRISIHVAWWGGREHREKWVGLSRALPAERAKEREVPT